MPKLWAETVASHRQDVSAAIADTTAALVFRDGLRGVTMSQIADETGIGRATLYKYFPDVDAILHAWHRRQIAEHLHHLHKIRDEAEQGRRLEAVLRGYAFIAHRARGHHNSDIGAALTRDEQLNRAHQQLHNFIRQLLLEAAETGVIRRDIAPKELATYCLHALGAARELPSTAAVHRLVDLTLAALS